MWRWSSGSRGIFSLVGKAEAPLEADSFYRLTTSDPCLSAWFGPRRLNSSLMCALKSQVLCLLPHTCTKAILTPFPWAQVLETYYLIHSHKNVKHTLFCYAFRFLAPVFALWQKKTMAMTRNSHFIDDLILLYWEMDFFTLFIKVSLFCFCQTWLAHISSIVTRLNVLCNLDGSQCLNILSARHVPVTHDLSITVVHSFQTPLEASSVRCLPIWPDKESLKTLLINF